ncbi:MAG: hypothetical protein ACRDZ6_10730 [Acidimicrobiales bacterium]
MARLSQADKVAGIASLVLLISFFLPWFRVGVGTSDIGYSGTLGTVSGLDVHGYLYIAVIVSILLVIYVALRAGFATLPMKLPLPHETLILVATAIDLVLTVIAFLFKPSSFFGVRWGWDWGAVIALVAAVVAAAPLGRPFIQSKMAAGGQARSG